jgi:hypothetical protein
MNSVRIFRTHGFFAKTGQLRISQTTGNLGTKTHFSGKRVNQALRSSSELGRTEFSRSTHVKSKGSNVRQPPNGV